MYFFFHTRSLSSFWTSRGHRQQVSSLLSPGSCLQFFAHRVQQSHCSSIFHRLLLTHALALSASQSVHERVPMNIYEYAIGGFELTKLTCTRLEDNLMRHRGDRHYTIFLGCAEAAGALYCIVSYPAVYFLPVCT